MCSIFLCEGLSLTRLIPVEKIFSQCVDSNRIYEFTFFPFLLSFPTYYLTHLLAFFPPFSLLHFFLIPCLSFEVRIRISNVFLGATEYGYTREKSYVWVRALVQGCHSYFHTKPYDFTGSTFEGRGPRVHVSSLSYSLVFPSSVSFLLTIHPSYTQVRQVLRFSNIRKARSWENYVNRSDSHNMSKGEG